MAQANRRKVLINLLIVGETETGRMLLASKLAKDLPISYAARDMAGADIGFKTNELNSIREYNQRFYSAAQGIIIVYENPKDMSAFESVTEWLANIREYVKESVEIIVVEVLCGRHWEVFLRRTIVSLVHENGLRFMWLRNRSDLKRIKTFNNFANAMVYRHLSYRDLERPTGRASAVSGEYERALNMLICKVCMDREVQSALYPCGHLVLCDTCLQTQLMYRNTCPICRSWIQDYYKVVMIQ